MSTVPLLVYRNGHDWVVHGTHVNLKHRLNGSCRKTIASLTEYHDTNFYLARHRLDAGQPNVKIEILDATPSIPIRIGDHESTGKTDVNTTASAVASPP